MEPTSEESPALYETVLLDESGDGSVLTLGNGMELRVQGGAAALMGVYVNQPATNVCYVMQGTDILPDKEEEPVDPPPAKNRRRGKYTVSVFVCSTCQAKFDSPEKLASHTQQEHQQRHSAHRCVLCCRDFAEERFLKQHMLSHDFSKMHMCTECGKGFRDKNNLTLHLLKHRGNDRYVCPECGKKFSVKRVFLAHVRTHSAQLYYCSDCDESFTSRMLFTEHVATHRPKEKQCSDPGK